MSRERFDGYQLAWLNNGPYQGLIPFIIEDETPREERAPNENQRANRVTGIDTITLIAREIDLPERIMGAALGAGWKAVRDESLGAASNVYQVGSHRLGYLTPDDEGSPLHEHIALNRPVPFRVRFKTEGIKPAVDPVEAASTRIEFV
ncbi:MAG: hypothetical protein OXG68_19165 [Chloroflexi bacterium]|nr:hypothetical protein [Chloroflexota bacterium]